MTGTAIVLTKVLIVVVVAMYITAQAAEAVPPALFLFTAAATVGCTALAVVIAVLRGRLARAVAVQNHAAEVV